MLRRVSVQEVPPGEGKVASLCSYGDFGLSFLQHAVTEERVHNGVSSITGRPIEFGPMRVGPAGLARLTATGEIGDPTVRRTSEAEPLRFSLRIPVDLRFTVALPATEHRFHADVEVELTLTARAGAPLRIVIEIEEPTKRDVTVDLRADGLASTVLQLVSGMEYDLKKFVARYISKEIDKPHVREARDVDLLPYVNGAER
jgi:hypothetical protein